MNLVSNALDAIGARRGNVWVTTRTHPAPHGAEACRSASVTTGPA